MTRGASQPGKDKNKNLGMESFFSLEQERENLGSRRDYELQMLQRTAALIWFFAENEVDLCEAQTFAEFIKYVGLKEY